MLSDNQVLNYNKINIIKFICIGIGKLDREQNDWIFANDDFKCILMKGNLYFE